MAIFQAQAATIIAASVTTLTDSYTESAQMVKADENGEWADIWDENE